LDDIEKPDASHKVDDPAEASDSDLAKRVEQLANELARTRGELKQYREQQTQLDELVWDLGELKAERESLIQQLKDQAEQIEALRHEVAATRAELTPAKDDEAGPVEEGPLEDRPAEEVPPPDQPAAEGPPGDQPVEEDRPAEEVPPPDQPEEGPPGDQPVEEDRPAEDAPPGDQPVEEDRPAEDAPQVDQLAEEGPPEGQPAEEEEDRPAEDAPPDQPTEEGVSEDQPEPEPEPESPYKGDDDLPTEVSIARSIPAEAVPEHLVALPVYGEGDDDETAVADVLALQRERQDDEEGFNEDSVTQEADGAMKELVVSTRQDDTSQSLIPSPRPPEPVALIPLDAASEDDEPETLSVADPGALAYSEPEPEPESEGAEFQSEFEPLAVSAPIITPDGDPKVRARLATQQIRQSEPPPPLEEVPTGPSGVVTPLRISVALAGLLLVLAAIHWLTKSDDGTDSGTKPKAADSRPDMSVTPDRGAPDRGVPDIATAAPAAPPRPRRLTGRARRRHRALLARARRLIERRKVAQARELLTEALELRDDWRVRRLLAVSHERAKDLSSAVDHLEKGVHHAPPRQRSRLHNHRGRMLLKLGQKEAACAAFKAAVEAWPKSAGARKRLRRFCN
jgi:hypothetical protein